jgi:hypothetical protein
MNKRIKEDIDSTSKSALFGIKKIFCCNCNSYTGYYMKFPYAIWTDTSNVICKKGFGCRKTCQCDDPVPDLSSWNIKDDNNGNLKYKCKNCNKWIAQKDYLIK